MLDRHLSIDENRLRAYHETGQAVNQFQNSLGEYAVEEKRCPRCRRTKKVQEFYASRKSPDGLLTHCKDCDKLAGQQRAGTASRRHTMHQSNLKNYGLTVNDYNRILVAQGGGCAICGCPPGQMLSPRGFPRPLSVDHDHQTGEVRGLLCHKCNVGIGAFGDNLELLEAAASYLRSGRTFQPARLL